MFKVNKKDTSKTRANCCSSLVRFEQTLHLAWVLLWSFFEKQVNVCCAIGNILMSITSHIHNAANHAIAKNSCQRYCKNLKNWKILSCVFLLPLQKFCLCIVGTIFQVATSFSIFSTTGPSLAQYRKQLFYIYLCYLNNKSLHGFWQPHLALKKPITYLMSSLFWHFI